jgi:MFS family permease
MTSLTDSEQMVALVQASTALPLMLLALWSGAVADRYNRRNVMLASQAFTMVASALLAAFAWLGWLNAWSLLAFTFLIGCGAAMKTPAWQAGVGEMVPRAVLPQAIALNSVGFNLARSVGPAIGGVVVAVGGAATAFAVNAVSNIGLFVALLRWRRKPTARALPPEPFFSAIAAGLRYAIMAPVIVAILPRAALFGLGASAVQAVLPLVVRDRIGGDALTYGLMLGSFGVGAVAGGLLIGWLRRNLSPPRQFQVSALTFALATIVTGLSTNLLLTLCALAVNGAGWLVALATMNVTVQLNAPNWVLARTLALYQMAAFGGIAVGSWLAGLLADALGVRDALLCAAGIQVAVIMITHRLPLGSTDQPDIAPFEGWQNVEPASMPEPNSAITIITEFRIDDDNLAVFLGLMQERRHIRRRNGGRFWRLFQDTNDPAVWIESYEVPSWPEYLRHRERFMVHEARLFARIRTLHSGEAPPRVRRFAAVAPTPTGVPLGNPEIS